MIYLPPPQPVLNKDIRISGDVEIHPTASIAPGAILQAAPDCSIIIGADVCIGMGVIINACKGAIAIDSGAILGSGVLIIGASKIGNNCCIGTSSTVFQTDVAAMTVIEPGSILGDLSRSVETEQAQAPNVKSANNYQAKSATKSSAQAANKSDSSNNFTSASSPPEEVTASVEPHVQSAKPPVVGQVYINELLVTLFPHSKGLNSNSDNSS